jgi:Resolvase, N terminal domain
MMIQRNRRVAIYTRVSTDGQTCANQENELRAVAERKGCTVVKVYTDRGISGAKGRDKRPGFDALCKDVVRREFDVVLAWSVDRLGRSLQDLVSFLSEIHAAGVDLYLHVQGLDTATPAGKAMGPGWREPASRARRAGGRQVDQRSTPTRKALSVRRSSRAIRVCARSPLSLASPRARCSASRRK